MATIQKPFVAEGGLKVIGGPVEFQGKDYMKLPSGTTEERAGGVGAIRFNLTLSRIEQYDPFTLGWVTMVNANDLVAINTRLDELDEAAFINALIF